MKIAIIGAGFTGLAAAFALIKKGHSITIFEKDRSPGGLAIGFQHPRWKWTLEQHYHHWFTNDDAVLQLAKELKHSVLIKRPKTSVFVDNAIYQFDSPLTVLTFPKISFLSRIRMATTLAFLRYNPYWQLLERIDAVTFLEKTMGHQAFATIWEPQLINKFGEYYTNISLAWFWARIRKRTATLAYPKGGFLRFAQALADNLKKQGAIIHYATPVLSLQLSAQGIHLTTALEKYTFDKILVTLPSPNLLNLLPDITESYREKLSSLHGLGAINLVVRMKKPFLQDGTYWLSLCDREAPLMAIIEHTNFVDKKYYNNEHLLYLGKYLPSTHPFFSYTGKRIFKIYLPYLQRINPQITDNIIAIEKFAAHFAQPIIPPNYSRLVPSIKTPLPNIYLANMQQVYPWDRGTNYAVAIGTKAARIMTQE